MMANRFQVLSNIKNMDTSGIMYSKNGEIDIRAMIPEFAIFCDALERGESWYDIMFPRNQAVTLNNSNNYNWQQAGKKRKNPFADNTYHKNKKSRYY